jgi:hypothetical protein
VIVDEVEDLDRRSIRERPVRRIGLPELVGELRCETNERGPRAFVRLGRDQPVPAKDPPDRGDRGDLFLQPTREVMRDRLGAGVVAGRREILARRQDQGLDRCADLVRARARSPRARLEGRVSTLAVPRHQLIDPASRKVVRPRKLARTAPLEHDRIHHVPAQTHRDTPLPAWLSTMS